MDKHSSLLDDQYNKPVDGANSPDVPLGQQEPIQEDSNLEMPGAIVPTGALEPEVSTGGIGSFMSSIVQKGSEAIEAMQNSYSIVLSSGQREVPNFMGRTTLVRRSDGLVYFQSEKDILYEVLEVSWDGPYYQTRIVTDTAENSKTKKGRKGRLVGAAVGALFGPGGALLGAAIGTGSKSKTKGQSRSETYEEQTEQPAALFMTLQNLMQGKVVQISTDVMSNQAYELLGLLNPYDSAVSGGTTRNMDYAGDSLLETPVQVNAVPVVPTSVSTIDPYEELKKAKELLDLGILTQEEFDQKKRELLGM